MGYRKLTPKKPCEKVIDERADVLTVECDAPDNFTIKVPCYYYVGSREPLWKRHHPPQVWHHRIYEDVVPIDLIAEGYVDFDVDFAPWDNVLNINVEVDEDTPNELLISIETSPACASTYFVKVLGFKPGPDDTQIGEVLLGLDLKISGTDTTT